MQPRRVPIIREAPSLRSPHPEPPPSPFLILILTRCRWDLAAVAIFGGIQVPSGCDKQLGSMNRPPVIGSRFGNQHGRSHLNLEIQWKQSQRNLMGQVLRFSFISYTRGLIYKYTFLWGLTLLCQIYIVTTLYNSSYAKHLLVQYMLDYAMECNQLLC